MTVVNQRTYSEARQNIMSMTFMTSSAVFTRKARVRPVMHLSVGKDCEAR